LVILQDYLRVGGTERQTLHLARHAAGLGHSVTLILFRPGGPLAGEVADAPYAVRVLQRRDTRVCLYAPGLARALDVARPEAVLCMGRTANCYAGWIQERRPQVAVVGTIRTGKVLFPWHVWSLSAVRGVLVNSRWWKRRLREWGLPAERVHVVHNALLGGGLPGAVAGDRESLRTRAKVGENTVVLLQVASFRRGKRHAELLRLLAPLAARKDLPDWRLWLVGSGSERERCERLVLEWGLEERVRFWGYQENPHPFYRVADLAVSASVEDSLPNFLIEAQSVGMPVVAVDYRGVREACEPGVSGEVVPRHAPERFREVLVELMGAPERRTAMGERARAFALERFSPDRQGDVVLDFLEQLRG